MIGTQTLYRLWLTHNKPEQVSRLTSDAMLFAIGYALSNHSPLCISCPKARICWGFFPIYSYLFFTILGSFSKKLGSFGTWNTEWITVDAVSSSNTKCLYDL